MKNFLKKIFVGFVVLETTESPINGRIKVDEDLFGRRRLLVGGISQSGVLVEKIWASVIEPLNGKETKSCLILGLGAGTAAKLAAKQFPGVQVAGIEIDPEMVKLGKKYFGLGEIKNLEIKIGDAIREIGGTISELRKFDLILVDLYLGDKVVEETEDLEFLKNVKKLLNLHGLVIFNRLDYGENRKKSHNFEANLGKIFKDFEAKKILTNKLFLCRK